MAKVDAVYKLDSSVTQDTLDKISADFSAAEQVRQMRAPPLPRERIPPPGRTLLSGRAPPQGAKAGR